MISKYIYIVNKLIYSIMSKTYLVLRETGVGKFIFINDISEGKTNLLVKDTKNAVTTELNVAQLIKIEFVINS